MVLSEAKPSQIERVTGAIERVTFHSEASGFCVLRVRVKGHRDVVTVTGSAASVGAGEFLEAEGYWNNDKNYGLQFKAKHLATIAPSTVDGIQKYLASGMIKGIGPHFAKVLIKAFGDKVFDVIENEPNRLSSLSGIGKKRQQQVVEAWAEQKVIREIMVFLHSNGVGTTRAVRIYKTYGDQAIDTIRDNPYRLALDIHGIGFLTADKIAKQLGIANDAMIRARAGVCHVLQEMCKDGHCAALENNLIEKAVKLLEINESIIEQALTAEIDSENLILELIDGEKNLFLAALFYAEQSVAKHMQRLLQGGVPWEEFDSAKAIPWVEGKIDIQLSPSQCEAVESALKNKVMIITGGPGVGKTTVVNSILSILRAKQVRVSLCAPTGRAAKRLSETTNLEAKTIHRLLEFDPTTYGFKCNQENPFDTDLVVIDEASMLDIVLMNSLLKAIPDHAAVLIIGDVDQLPSVGPGAVLHDLISSEIVPTVMLTEIFRQASSSKIIVNAHRINHGEFPLSHDNPDELTDFYFIPGEDADDIHAKLLAVITKRIPQRFGFNPLRDIQVLTPMNRGGIGARVLNNFLQEQLNAQAEPKVKRFGWTFAPGDKVMQQVNNYDKDVYNGDIGFITQVDTTETKVFIQFDGRLVDYDYSELDELSLAYATTIHKSQGSEYPVVVIPVATQHFMMLARNLLYTGVTRGKKLVILIGQKKAVAIALRNVTSNQRLTHLQGGLRGPL